MNAFFLIQKNEITGRKKEREAIIMNTF